MMIRALQQIAVVWPMALTILRQVKVAARLVLDGSYDGDTVHLQVDPRTSQDLGQPDAVDGGFTGHAQLFDDQWLDEFFGQFPPVDFTPMATETRTLGSP